MANDERGEITVTLGGVEYTLRPTFEALAEMESQSGIGVLPLARRFMTQDWGVRDLAAVLAPAITAGGGKIPDNLGQLIIAAGPLRVAATVARFLSDALVGDAKNADAPAVH